MKPRIPRSRSRNGRVYYVPFFLSAIAVLVYQLPNLSILLQYDREALGRGQFWRWVTGHWTHHALDHLVLDVLTFLVLATLCNRLDRRAFRWAMVWSLLLIPLTLWALEPSLVSYRGLSGIDSALLVLATLLLSHHAKVRDPSRLWWIPLVALFLFGAKLIVEASTGQALFVEAVEGIRVVPWAHLAGALGGLLAYGISRLGTKRLFS